MKTKTVNTRIAQLLFVVALIGFLIGSPLAMPSVHAGDCPAPTSGTTC